jgi:hypothetical protein
MNTLDLKEHLSILKLSSADLARLLDVSERTIHRWLSGDVAMPGAATRALEAWHLLENAGLPWRPDGVPLLRAHAGANASMVLPIRSERTIKDIIESVYARGGPNTPWVVRLDQRQACLEHAWIKYKPLSNCSFIPLSFGRTDRAPDLTRDFGLIEEGYACIALALSKAAHLQSKHNWMETAL